MIEAKVKQHYIPRFYLKRFVDSDGTIYVYDVKQDRKYERNYESLGFVKNLYETEWEGDNPKEEKYILRNDIEDTLAEYENEFALFVKELDKRVMPDQNPNALICNKEEKRILRRFAANL